MTINMGISEGERKKVASGLEKLLADSYTLYLKTHNYHWNVTGPMFQNLHLLFETEYQDLANAVDEIAERIRALGFKAPASYTAFSKLATIKEETGEPNAENMIKNLIADQETIVREAHDLYTIAEAAGDEATVDLITSRMKSHEKSAWMLRSLLED